MTSLQIGLTQAQEGSQYQIILPLITYPEHISSFGMAIYNRIFVDRAKEANADWIHYNGLLWSEIQKLGATSDWSTDHAIRVDRDLKAISDAGMEVILTICSTPAWARDHKDFCGPMREENIIDFANFVGEVVQRYSQPPYNVTYYEIWNEQDDRKLREGEVPYDVYTSPFGC